jgi:hypothetical protein
MLPVLALLGDGREWRLREAVERLADRLHLISRGARRLVAQRQGCSFP